MTETERLLLEWCVTRLLEGGAFDAEEIAEAKDLLKKYKLERAQAVD